MGHLTFLPLLGQKKKQKLVRSLLLTTLGFSSSHSLSFSFIPSASPTTIKELCSRLKENISS